MEEVLKQYEEPQLVDLDEEVGEAVAACGWICATGGSG